MVRVVVMDLDKTGYGPEGTLTREAWRKECKDKLLAGKIQFESWQNSWKYNKNDSLPNVHLGITLHHADGSCAQSHQYPGFKSYALDFSGQVFDEPVNAYECIFENHAYFTGASFKKIANFHAARFNESTDFSQAFFEATADFRKASFVGNAHFNDAIFVNYVIFIEVKFDGTASFSGVTFREKALFHDAKFGKDAHFTNTTFKFHAVFRDSTFKGDANFKGAWFLGEAQFFKAQFHNQCRFDVKLGEHNEMDNWIQLRRFTRFKSLVNFENASIKNVGHFEGVRFKGEFPNFLGVDNANTLLMFSDDSFFNKNDTQSNAPGRIAQLKRLADEQGQIDQALMFNAFELNAKRALSIDAVNHLKWWQKLFNGNAWLSWTTYAYNKLSNYGRSFTRPLLAYGVLMLVTFVLAIGHGLWASMDACQREGWNVYEQLYRDQVSCPAVATASEQKIPLTVPRAAFEYTAYRASGVLDFVDADKQTIAVANRLFNQPIEPMWMRIWGVLKAIASAALLFLAALGLRNKYRIK